MPDRSIERTAEAVLGALEFCGASPRGSCADAAPIRGLGVVDDDLTYLFVPEVEERLGVKVPLNEWATVDTVGDVTRMFHQHVLLQTAE